MALLKSGFRSMANGSLLADLSFVFCSESVDVSAPLVCFFVFLFLFSYSSVFVSVIMEAISSACAFHSFVIRYDGVSTSIT